MPLAPNEINPGAIAYLSAAKLNADHRVTITGPQQILGDGTVGISLLTRDGPCLCVSLDDDVATWVPLTNQERPERVRIEAAWVANGYGPIGAGQTFLQDGAFTYAGAIEAFIDAAAGERAFQGDARPTVAQAGVARVLQEIANQAHRAAILARE